MRSGLIAQKLGMTRIFQEDGTHVPVTVLGLQNCQVVGQRTQEKDGYTAAAARRRHRPRSKNTTKAERGQFAVAKVEPKRQVTEFRVDRREPHRGWRHDAGRPLRRGPAGRRDRHLDRQGFCRRHEALEFRRPARHARRVRVAPLARFDRQRQDPGKVFKGKKMAGHMGQERVTTQNLKVVRTDVERGLIMVAGRGSGLQGRLDHDQATRSRRRRRRALQIAGLVQAGR